MNDFADKILTAVGKKGYRPLKPKALARKLGDGPAACYIGESMLAQNPPQHTRQRRAVSKAFTAKAVEAMREQIVGKVNGLLDEVTAGGRKQFDLANEVAYRIPISVVCGMLGVPAELQSCHTATIGGYVVEGHVPADLIHRLLNERPSIAGIAVPVGCILNTEHRVDRTQRYLLIVKNRLR